MAFSSTDLDAINSAIATGELSVEVNGRKVVYRSMADLVRARDLISADLAAAATAASSSTSTRRGAYRVTFATHRGD